MKKITFYLILAGCLLFFAQCDKIEGPFMETEQQLSVDTPYFEVPSGFYRKYLLEDYTGQSCINCPKAHTIMHELQSKMGDTLLCMAVHSGNYAVPSGTVFTADYRTEIGNAWATDFAVSNYPSGMINRQVMSNGKRVLAYTIWKNVLDTLTRTAPEIGLQIKDTMVAASPDTAYVFVKVSCLKDFSRSLKLYVVLLEDSIVSPQLNGARIDTNYTHNHMLRTAVSPLQGSLLSSGGETVTAGTILIRGYALYRQPVWKWGHCSVLAFVCDAETEEVLQAETFRCR